MEISLHIVSGTTCLPRVNLDTLGEWMNGGISIAIIEYQEGVSP